MVGQHDAARTDADGRSRVADMREHDCGRCAGDPRHAMMFGDPIASIAEGFGMPREIGGVGKRFGDRPGIGDGDEIRSEEHTSELQSLMRISYAVFCLKKKTKTQTQITTKQ